MKNVDLTSRSLKIIRDKFTGQFYVALSYGECQRIYSQNRADRGHRFRPSKINVSTSRNLRICLLIVIHPAINISRSYQGDT